MAFVKTATITSDAGTVYADATAWIAEHGACGTENIAFVTEASIALVAGGTGVTIALTYADEAACIAHENAGGTAEIIGNEEIVGTTWTLVSRVAT